MTEEAGAVFLGGGHAHALALLRLRGKWRGEKPLLISDGEHSPYSGMLPGYIAGHYRRGECFVNLPRLARETGARFLRARVSSLCADANEIVLSGGGRIHFSLLSVNVGSEKKTPFASPNARPVKPVEPFVEWLRKIPEEEPAAIVGAGAAGVEVALALRPRKNGFAPLALAGRRFLPGYPAAVRKKIRELLAARGVAVCEGEAEAHEENQLIVREKCGSKKQLAAGKVIFATSPSAPEWLAASGAAATAGGWMQINSFLQSVSHPRIFAAGDCAECEKWNLPKSGVVAVRQAPVLAQNILASLRGGKMRAWNPPRRFLAILGDGCGGAFACYGAMHLRGAAAWRWKRELDSRFMRRVFSG